MVEQDYLDYLWQFDYIRLCMEERTFREHHSFVLPFELASECQECGGRAFYWIRGGKDRDGKNVLE